MAGALQCTLTHPHDVCLVVDEMNPSGMSHLSPLVDCYVCAATCSRAGPSHPHHLPLATKRMSETSWPSWLQSGRGQPTPNATSHHPCGSTVWHPCHTL